ncbi:MAG: hypothetical protein K2M17_00930, partial [Bacilli bacterium]|nr:hypothetical protein [Bacilli bacterium]
PLSLIFDCETATLPYINDYNIDANLRKKISIAKPLIYDIGWQVVSSTGRVYSRHSFLIQETFFVPSVFNTAYYRDKRPIYLDWLNNGKISTGTWKEVTQILLQDMERSDLLLAYNAMFDFKKAIPFTERYIRALYSDNYWEYEERQRKSIKNMIANNGKSEPNDEFDGFNMYFRGKNYPISDLWALSCEMLINEERFKKDAIKNCHVTASGLYFKTTAERTTQYILKDDTFTESHTALEDVFIETDILLKLAKKMANQIPQGLSYFPFQELGETIDYCVSLNKKGKPIFTKEELVKILDILYQKSLEYDIVSSFSVKLSRKAQQLIDFIALHYSKEVETSKDKVFRYWIAYGDLYRSYRKMYFELGNLKKNGKAYKAKKEALEQKEKELNALIDEIVNSGFELTEEGRIIEKAGNENE